MSFRSILFTPANRLDRVAKGLFARPDWLALDLEDGVVDSEKDKSREKVEQFFSSGKTEQQRIAIRINSLSTVHGIKDMHAITGWSTWPEMIIIPKVESGVQIQQVRELAYTANHEPYILATLETALGVEHASQILRNGDPKLAAAYGSADHAAQTGGSMDPEALAWARGRIVNSAAIANIPAFDGVWLDYNDSIGLRKEAEICKNFGFAGKIAIHPNQVEAIHRVFTPSDSEIDEANQMILAAEASGGGAFSFKGKMIDPPILAKAKRIAGIEKERREHDTTIERNGAR